MRNAAVHNVVPLAELTVTNILGTWGQGPSVDATRGKYDAVGHCIYCQDSGPTVTLTSEHVVPYFMGGNVELLGSSCLKCNKITSRLDGYCANRVMHGFRHHYGIQSRTKSKPATVPVEFKTPHGMVTRHVAFKDAPKIMLLPVFDPPGMLIDAEPSGIVVPSSMTLWTTQDFKDRAEKMRQPGDESWNIASGGNYVSAVAPPRARRSVRLGLIWRECPSRHAGHRHRPRAGARRDRPCAA